MLGGEEGGIKPHLDTRTQLSMTLQALIARLLHLRRSHDDVTTKTKTKTNKASPVQSYKIRKYFHTCRNAITHM